MELPKLSLILFLQVFGLTVTLFVYGCFLKWLYLYLSEPVAVHYTCTIPEVESEEPNWSLVETDAPGIKVIFTMPSSETSRQARRAEQRRLEKALNRLTASDDGQVDNSSLIRCYDPATGKYLNVVMPKTVAGVDRAIESAARAQKQWAKSPFVVRLRLIKTLLEHILKNQDSIVEMACMDSGKTKVDAILGEILVTVEKLRWTIDHGEQALEAERRPTNLLMFYKVNEVRWEPRGVVAACVSWNYPFHNFMGPVIAALFTGNAIVVKVSEYTAYSSIYWYRIVHGALQACGYNSALVQIVHCWPSTAEHLTSHPGIAHLTFIGSQSIAHHVAKSAAKSLTETCLELGGKDPAIVLDDIHDIDRVVATLIRGIFQSSGQNCIGIERIICLPNIYEKVISKLTPIISNLRLGPYSEKNVDIGACISDSRFPHLEKLITQAVKQGARLLVGGKRYAHPKYPKGHYFSPTLLVDVTPTMAIAQEELFAPIALVMRAASVAEAIDMANNTPYALGASVFGRSTKDLEAVTNGVRAGMVAVNDFAAYYAVQLPFGGARGSGYGRFAGKEGLRALCNAKSVCRDRWPWLLKTTIPAPLQLPYRDAARAFQMAKAIVQLGYGGLRIKAEGLRNVMVASGAEEKWSQDLDVHGKPAGNGTEDGEVKVTGRAAEAHKEKASERIRLRSVM